MHDSSKVLLGSTVSTDRLVTDHKGEIAAGLAVHLTTADGLSVAAADGSKIGISLGSDLGKAKYTAVLRRGLKVPILLTDGFTPVVGTQVHISDTTGRAAASGAGATGVNAEYASAVLTGISLNADGTFSEIRTALIDMPGGL